MAHPSDVVEQVSLSFRYGHQTCVPKVGLLRRGRHHPPVSCTVHVCVENAIIVAMTDLPYLAALDGAIEKILSDTNKNEIGHGYQPRELSPNTRARARRPYSDTCPQIRPLVRPDDDQLNADLQRERS